MVPGASHDQHAPSSSPLRRLVLGLAFVVGASLFTCAGFFVYVGAAGPETSVYPGNRVPQRYLTVMRDVGALEDDEQIAFFYSDGLTDIRNGFYFVSDRKVAIYAEDAGVPLTVVTFAEIVDAHLLRDDSFFDETEIVLELADGRVLPFPVSSERDRDILFHEAIVRRLIVD